LFFNSVTGEQIIQDKNDI